MLFNIVKKSMFHICSLLVNFFSSSESGWGITCYHVAIRENTNQRLQDWQNEQHQKPPWRDLVSRSMWDPPRESKTSTRESRAKAPRKGCVKAERRKQRRKQSDSRNALKYSCARSFTGNSPRKQPRKVLGNKCRRERQNCARERTAKAVAKAYED